MSTPVTGTNDQSPVNVPAGISEGDLLIAVVIVSNPGFYTVPAGWTESAVYSPWTTYGYKSALLYKVASASEPSSYEFGAGIRTGFIMAYRNASSISTVGSWQLLSGTSMTFTGLAVPEGSMLISVFHDRENSGTWTSWTAPAGMTERLNAESSYWIHCAAELLNGDSSDRTWSGISGSYFPAAGILFGIS